MRNAVRSGYKIFVQWAVIALWKVNWITMRNGGSGNKFDGFFPTDKGCGEWVPRETPEE